MNDRADRKGATERREWLVEGRVQGVGFRAATRRRARELGVEGLAENLPDGRVRVVGVGEPNALERLADWLGDGPPAARVDGVTTQDIRPDDEDADRPERFVTR